MSDDPKCVAGCVPFYGGEKRHHKDCPYYPESLTKLNADRIEELEAKLDMVVETLEFYGDERNYESEYIPDECGCCGSWYEPKIHKDGQDSGDKARTTLAELTSSEAANGEAKGGNDE